MESTLILAKCDLLPLSKNPMEIMRLILSPFVPRNQMISRIDQSSDLCEINQGRDQEVCLPLALPWEGVLTGEELLF